MSKSINKGGKLPASARETIDSSDFTHDDLDFNLLKLDPELKAEFDAKGLVPRWINAPQYLKGGNFHKSGWRAYRKEVDSSRGAMDFNYGVSPEGYIIRNDLILAYKTKENHEKWRSHIRKKNEIQSGRQAKTADELRDAAREAGVKARIHEGYEEND